MNHAKIRFFTTLLPAFALLAMWSVVASGQAVSTPKQTSPVMDGRYTPLGAYRAGNENGTIPQWTGGLTESPDNYDPERHEVDPFPEDVPAYTITASNADQFQDILSPGQRALLETYPGTWKLNVYQSRRTAALPDWVYRGILRNRDVIDPGKPLMSSLSETARIGSPFPFPETGEQAVWNHNLRWRGLRVQRPLARAAVTPKGKYLLLKGEWDIAFPYGTPEVTEFSKRHPNVMLALVSKLNAPSLLANSATLVMEPIDPSVSPRKTWVYLNNLKRVIRRPVRGYGFPAPNTDSLRTIDDFDLFNGDTSKFEWTLHGRKEMLIPYNSYRLHSSDLDPGDIIMPGHINPEHARYELHRVWVVEGRLREGQNHVYSRRVFYIDEDSWQISVSESYHMGGELWRVAESHTVNFYTVPVTLSTLNVFHELTSRRYFVEGLDNQLAPHRFLNKADAREFSPNNLQYRVR